MKRLLAVFTRRLLRLAMAITPPEHREWISAALAEAELIRNETEAFRWGVGALSFACRCRLLTTSSTVRENLAMNRASRFSLLALIAVISALFATSTFRDATEILPASLRLASGQSVIRSDQLRQLAVEAEQSHDTSALAFAAIHFDSSTDPSEAMSFANKAITLDPSLSWIRYFVIRNYWRFNPFAADIPQVIAADPNNAVGYLLLAESIHRSDNQLSIHRTEWQSAMNHAFSAPTYDNYLYRRLQLYRQVMKRHDLPPLESTSAMLATGFMNASDVLSYGKQMISSGDPHDCAKVIRFAGMLQSGQTTFEWYIGENLRNLALPALGKQISLPLAAPPRTIFASASYSQISSGYTLDAVVVQISLLLAVLAIPSAGVLAAIVLLSRNPSERLQRLLRATAAFAITVALLTFVAYIPFASAYRSYQRAATVQDAAMYATTFKAFHTLPWNTYLFFVSGTASFYAWGMLVLVLVTILLLRIGVQVTRRRSKPEVPRAV